MAAPLCQIHATVANKELSRLTRLFECCVVEEAAIWCNLVSVVGLRL